MNVSTLKLELGDRIIVEVEVGNLPSQKCQAYLEGIKEKLVDFFPIDTKVIYVPIRDGKSAMTITQIKSA